MRICIWIKNGLCLNQWFLNFSLTRTPKSLKRAVRTLSSLTKELWVPREKFWEYYIFSNSLFQSSYYDDDIWCCRTTAPDWARNGWISYWPSILQLWCSRQANPKNHGWRRLLLWIWPCRQGHYRKQPYSWPAHVDVWQHGWNLCQTRNPDREHGNSHIHLWLRRPDGQHTDLWRSNHQLVWFKW